MRRFWIMLLAVAMALVIALPAGAGKPDCDDPEYSEHPICNKDDPAPEPDIWTCQARVDNGAVWVLGAWNGSAYVSDSYGLVDVDIPLCIDIDETHWDVTKWTVAWSGETLRKAPKGLKLVFEEEVHDTVYWQTEVSPTDGGTIWIGNIDDDDVVLNFGVDLDGVEHLVFVAMPRAGDKWPNINFTVTPDLSYP